MITKFFLLWTSSAPKRGSVRDKLRERESVPHDRRRRARSETDKILEGSLRGEKNLPASERRGDKIETRKATN